MKRLVVAILAAAGAASALAMPTKDELTKAQPLVAELMAPAMAKYKAAGYKEKAAAAAKVGDASSEFAKAAETEAAKFLLLKGAVNFYTRGEQYDKAAETVAELQREVKDVPPAVIAEITGKATGKISEAKAPKLYAIYRSAKLQVRAADEVKALAAKLKKAKSDALQRKYAEALAVSGDWKTAYAEFAKVGDAKLKEIAAAEAAGNAKSAESGEFWWAYDPAFEDADDFFKSHAAAYYRKALAAGEITGLKKTIVEQRIAGIAAEVGVSTEDGVQLSRKQADDAKAVDSKAILDAVAKLGDGNSIEKSRTVVSMLFPGWSLDKAGEPQDFGGFRPSHRGQNNVLMLHPYNDRRTPAVMSRTVTLSDKNPCLLLKMASFDQGSDYCLSVRVNGMNALWDYVICTPDTHPWEEVIVPLSAWRGSTVKIEIVTKAQNRWWREHAFFAHIAIVEGSEQDGRASLKDDKAAAEAKEDGVDEGREVTVVKTAEEGGAAWRYSFGVSNGNWAKPGFDDSGWQEGKGMFVDGGELMKDDRFVRVIRGQRTKWESDNIWLRQGFVFDGKSRQSIGKVTLRYYVWGAAEFYLNGEKVATHEGGGDLHQIYSRGYVEIDITEQAKKLLKLGKGNVLAMHASNSSGGRSYWIRYIDAGLSITTK